MLKIQNRSAKFVGVWIVQKNMKNTAEVCHAAGGAKPPKSTISNTKKVKGRPQSPKD